MITCNRCKAMIDAINVERKKLGLKKIPYPSELDD